jgi:hypothetical protein
MVTRPSVADSNERVRRENRRRAAEELLRVTLVAGISAATRPTFLSQMGSRAAPKGAAVRLSPGEGLREIRIKINANK